MIIPIIYIADYSEWFLWFSTTSHQSIKATISRSLWRDPSFLKGSALPVEIIILKSV